MRPAFAKGYFKKRILGTYTFSHKDKTKPLFLFPFNPKE